MRGPLADPAVDHGIAIPLEPVLLFVQRTKLTGGAESVSLRSDGPPPRDAARAGNVPAPQRTLAGIFRHVEALAPVLFGAPHVYQRPPLPHMIQHFVPE